MLDHASYDSKKKKLVLRKRKSTSSYNVKVPFVRFDDPRFFQRELLALVELSVSDECLRTVVDADGNSVTYSSYYLAAKARGLTDDNGLFDNAP